MSDEKKVLPLVELEKCSLTVSIPVTKGIPIISGRSVKDESQRFARLKDFARTQAQKEEFEKLRVLFEYAEPYEAKLEEMRNVEHKLIITLSFVSMEVMLDFYNRIPVVFKY